MVVRYIQKGPVDYTIVGTPTIVDGVVTNSPFNAIQTSTPLKLYGKEVEIIVKRTGLVGIFHCYIPNDSTQYGTLQQTSAGALAFYAPNGQVYVLYNAVDYNYIRFYKNASGTETLLQCGNDGITWDKTLTITDNVYLDQSPTSTSFPFFVNEGASFDLNNSYIKVNGQPFFGNSIFIPKNQIAPKPAAGNTVLLEGEPAFEKETNSLKVGNGEDTYDELPYLVDNSGEWYKPKEWVDIRSGALNNSIYLLVAHKADYSQYAKFSFGVTTSTSGNTYDVYVDGLKQTTVSSGTVTTLDWQTLALDSGYDVTYPSNLRAHIVRITPTQNTDTLTRFYCQGITGQQEQGLLWAHFELSNPIRVYAAFGNESSVRNYLLEAVTAKNDNLTYIVHTSSGGSGLYEIFAYCSSLKKIPVLTANSIQYTSGMYLSFTDVPLKKVVIKGNSGTENLYFLRNTKVQEFDIENGVVLGSGTGSLVQATNATNLKKLPTINVSNQETFVSSGLTSLQDTVIDDSSNSSRKLLRFYGSESAPVRGLKGLTVSNEAPFDGASPQLNVAYTGLDRQALRQLFKSMPYNVGYTVVGTPNIVDGVASGFGSGNVIGLSQNTPSANYFGFQIKFTISNALASQYEDVLDIRIDSSKYIRVYLYNFVETQRCVIYCALHDYTDSDNPVYKNFQCTPSAVDSPIGKSYKLIVNGTANDTTVSLYDVTQGSTLVNTETQTGKFILPINKLVSLGGTATGNRPFSGSIDLKETSISVEGVTWFNGAATRQLDPAATNVGNVTITNGVASGFSGSKYVNIPGTFSLNQDFEMRADFTTSASFTNNGTILAGPLAYRGGFCIDSKNLRFQGRYTVGSDAYQYILSFDTVLSASTNYVAKAVRNSNTLTITLYVNGVLTETKTGDLTDINFSTLSAFVIGSGGNGDLNGSVNLNNTYVIINNVKVFSGMVPMTKTCSVVGCTGTADLTADDKAIATGKGWELTVA